MNEHKPIRATVIPTSVLLAVLLTIAALWLSPNDVDRSDVARSGTDAQAERPSRDSKKLWKIVTRISSGESWAYSREPILQSLSRAIPRTLKVNIPGLLAGWGIGFLLGCIAGSCAGRSFGKAFAAVLLIAVIIPAPIWICFCRMALIESGLFRLSAGGFIPASITVAVLGAPLIALNQCILVGKAIRRPDVRFATALRMPWRLRWRLILWHCRSYWWSELALLAVAFCEGSMLVERVYGIKGIGDAMYIACIKSDPCLVVAMVGATALLVNLGVVATSQLTSNENGKAVRK